MGGLGSKLRGAGLVLERSMCTQFAREFFHNMNDKKNIIITGSDGFVGKNLLKFLGHGDQNIYEFNTCNWQDQAVYAGEWREFLYSIPPTINYVVHLGAISDSRYADFDLFNANTLATAEIVHTLKGSGDRSGARLIFFSSCAAINPVTLYGWSKNLAEELVKSLLPRGDYCILRPYNIYGDDESMKGNPSLVWKMKTNDNIEVYSDYVRDFIHVKDVCDFVWSLMFREWQPGIYDIGTGIPMTAVQLYEIVNGKPPKNMCLKPDHIDSYLVAEEDRMPKNFTCDHTLIPKELV